MCQLPTKPIAATRVVEKDGGVQDSFQFALSEWLFGLSEVQTNWVRISDVLLYKYLHCLCCNNIVSDLKYYKILVKYFIFLLIGLQFQYGKICPITPNKYL